ncbi:MAG: CHASE2 domain-containing protein [Proteobacteria bacterium]|nr:MAG: CHASE2 domain-containing protein [Pseudomonadota bacterium]
MADAAITPSNWRKDFFHASVTVLIVTAICVLAARFVPLVQLVENWVYDLRVASLTPSMPQSDGIIIVTITEDTLSTLPYRSPLDRQFLSNLLHHLEQKGAKLIGVDILFDQPTESEKDEALRRTLHDLNIPVVVAFVDADASLTERQTAFMRDYLDGVERGLAYVAEDTIDGTVRSIYIRNREGGRSTLGFAAAVAKVAGVEVPDVDVVPLDYRGRPDVETPPFRTFPAHAVPLLPSPWFSGKIVLIGADLLLSDRHRTPFAAGAGSKAGRMPGVVIHAHALAQLLEGRRGRRLDAWEDGFIIFLLSAIGMMLAVINAPVGVRSGVGAVLVVAGWIGGFFLYQQGGPLLPLVMPTIALTTSAGVGTAHLWRQEWIQKRFIRDAFSKYLAPAVIEQLVADPARLALGGEKREVTFLFTDIAGFTSLTEQTEPTVLVQLLNEYLDETCNIVLRHGGTIDKIVGDALHVMFNAPSDQRDHAERGVTCAMDLDAFCQSYRLRQASCGIELGETRIGVNTGSAVVGNFGGDNRFDYTAHGDAVNTAARLESANRLLGTRICASRTTVEKCEHLHFRPVGRLLLAGKTEGIDVFEPLSEAEAASEKTADYVLAYRLMKQGDREAADAFRSLTNKYPDDTLIAFHTRRLAAGEGGNTIVVEKK